MGRSFLGLSREEYKGMTPRVLTSMITEYKAIKFGRVAAEEKVDNLAAWDSF